MRFVAISLALVGVTVSALSACKSPPTAPAPAPAALPPGLAGNETRPIPPGTPPAIKTAVRHGLTWIEDDGASALALGKAQGLPVLVDLWAPWCHTCLSMQEYVLTVANFASLNHDFILLSINTENVATNAAFMKKVPFEVLPTFYIYDPKADAPATRWLGSASPGQFARFLVDGKRALPSAAQGLAADDPLALTLAGDKAMGSADYKGAAVKYADALAKAPADWPRRPDVLVAQMTAFSKAEDFASCAKLGASAQGNTGTAVSAGDFASYTVDCAGELPEKDATRKAALTAARTRLTPMCHDDRAAGELTADDRGEVCGALADALDLLHDAPAARKARARELEILGKAADAVPDDVKLTFDGARTTALIAEKRFAEAEAMLKAREAAVKDSYLPAQYLARLYKAEQRWDDGLAAADRAIAKAEGPRKGTLWSIRADICKGKGDAACERAAVQGMIDTYAALPESDLRTRMIERSKQRLDTIK